MMSRDINGKMPVEIRVNVVRRSSTEKTDFLWLFDLLHGIYNCDLQSNPLR